MQSYTFYLRGKTSPKIHEHQMPVDIPDDLKLMVKMSPVIKKMSQVTFGNVSGDILKWLRWEFLYPFGFMAKGEIFYFTKIKLEPQ